MLTGNSIIGKGKRTWRAYFEEGVILGNLKGSGFDESDSGTWRVTEDNLYCRTWTKWGKATEGCKKVYQPAEKQLIFIPTGPNHKSDIVTLTEGNTYELQ